MNQVKLAETPIAPGVVAGRQAAPFSGGARLGTLVLTRWIAISGQLVALIVAGLVSDFEFPLGFTLATVGLSVVVNIIVSRHRPAATQLGEFEAALHLSYDLIQLSALLYMTGGLTNPFSLLLLAPITISATILSPRVTGFVLGLGLFLSLALLGFHMELPWRPGALVFPPLYLFGVWVALALGMVFVALYAARVAIEARRRREALAALEVALAHEHQLAALGTLAAATAHELGTPLCTISVTAGELLHEAPDGTQTKADIELIASQARRCRAILQRLAATSSEARDPEIPTLPVGALVREAARPYLTTAKDKELDFISEKSKDTLAYRQQLPNRPEMLYGLGNLLENALNFADKKVSVSIELEGDELVLRILDDGPGFSTHLLSQLGEPYISSRKSKGGDSEVSGLGLGIFISKTLLERMDGRLSFANRTDRTGAIVEVRWPKSAYTGEDG